MGLAFEIGFIAMCIIAYLIIGLFVCIGILANRKKTMCQWCLKQRAVNNNAKCFSCYIRGGLRY